MDSAELETRLRRWTVVLGLLIIALLVGTAVAWTTISRRDVLRLRTLSIVDEHGVERVRIGGQLPDAMVNGKHVPRGEPAAGILLYDDTGQERGGYVTFSPSRNVVLTLDTRQRQVALFAAGPDDGAVARLWPANGNDWVELRADAARTGVTVGRSNEIVFQEPPMSKTGAAAVCSGLQGDLRQLKTRPPVQEVLRACKERMPDAACRKCLGLAN
jgi:hypothetical protein